MLDELAKRIICIQLNLARVGPNCKFTITSTGMSMSNVIIISVDISASRCAGDSVMASASFGGGVDSGKTPKALSSFPFWPHDSDKTTLGGYSHGL